MSNETRHTPGPWTVHGEPHDLCVRAGGSTVAEVIPREARAANARLIAAAPELLEALSQASDLLHRHMGQYGADELDERGLEVIRAAIAKATGEVP